MTKIDRLARSTSDLYRIISTLTDKGAAFKVLDDPAIDTSSRTGKLVMGFLALIAEFENDIRRQRQMDGIKKARERGTRFRRKPLLIPETIQQVRKLRKAGKTVPEIMVKRTSARLACIGHLERTKLLGQSRGCDQNAYVSGASHVRFEG